MSDIVTDPDLLNSLEGNAPNAPASPQSLGIVTDPDQINHLESKSAPPSDMPLPPSGYDANGQPTQQDLAFEGGAINSIPVAGPYIEKGLENAAAWLRSKVTGEPQDQLANAMQSRVAASESAYPATTTAGNVTGAVLGTLPLASTGIGARALGLSGTVPMRMAQGAAGGATIGAADSAARGSDPLAGAETGVVLGAGAPIAGKAIGAVAKGVFNALPTAATAPFSDLSQTARNMLTTAMQGETPQSIAAAHAALGPSGFVGDINNPMASLTKSIADQPEQAAGQIRSAYQARTASDGDRINTAITNALGPEQDVAALTRSDEQARSAAADPLYNAWRNTQVPPTDALQALMPRLNAAGVSSGAANKMAISGVPGFQQWFKPDPVTGQMTLDTTSAPTAQTYDFMKQALDDKIGGAINQGEKGNARLYQGLKSDLVVAIDNHPDPNVAGVWQQARQAWADPTSIINARQDGATALARSTNPDELKQQFQDYSPPEQQAFLQGVRGNVSDIFGGTKNGDTLVKNQLLAPNSQKKLSVLIGPDKTQDLVNSLQQEDALAQKANRITGGSPTHQNMQGSVVAGPAAIPGVVANYARNFAIDRPGSWLGLTPGSVISQGEAAAMAKARSQIAPILTTPNGPNADLANALLNMSTARAGNSAAAGQIGNLASVLINSAGRQQAQKYLPSRAAMARELISQP